ncbi:hypothetical protein [Labrenzia sp. VG12]|uniref:hypothetical protein n=1 Tax=Labrenzia sp. VG12 TaxID=2021862 RepID=UPI0018DFBBBE|nr:hypothetical protein [Labrenzia sp. VG12]
MAKRSFKFEDTLICLTGFLLGALFTSAVIGLTPAPQTELQKIKWRYQTDDTLTGFLADGANRNQPEREMLR